MGELSPAKEEERSRSHRGVSRESTSSMSLQFTHRPKTRSISSSSQNAFCSELRPDNPDDVADELGDPEEREMGGQRPELSNRRTRCEKAEHECRQHHSEA